MTIRRRHAAVSAVATGALLLAGCGSAGGGNDDADTGAGDAGTQELADTITIGIEQAPDAYNTYTADNNSVYNTYVTNVTQQDFIEVQPDGTVKPNETFGSYEKVSDDPLTVEYTFHEDAVWSDGTPIDFDDALLAWAAYSGTHPSGETDADGNPLDLFRPASTNGYAEVEMPQGEPGDKSFSMVFTNPYADWEVLGAQFLPAHIAAEQGGLSPDDDGAALVEAILGSDTATLAPVAEFWNTGWAFQTDLPELPDLALIPSSGPYKYDNASNGTLTLTRNEAWWGEPAKTENLVFKLVDANEMVQALQNGEIDVFDPSNATADMLSQLESLGDAVTVETGESLTYSHIDLDSSATGVFNDQRVRQAFAKCVPREELVEKFARPVYPEAQVLKLHEILPAQAEYEEALEQVPAAHEYDEVDIEGAKALLAEAGVTTPLTVRLTFSQQSTLRADQAALVKASCDQAGFNVEPKPDPDVFTSLASAPGTWDAAVFGWAGSGLIASGQSIYITGGNQNYGKYTNPEVDRIWGELVQVTDPADALPLQIELEEQLWSNLYNVTLYANPGMTAWSSSLEGPEYNPTQYGATWDAETWTKSLS